MLEIARLEQESPERSPNSVHPLDPKPRKPVQVRNNRNDKPDATANAESTVFGSSQSSHYFPCQYFDYIAGTSTGGYELLPYQCHIV